MNIQDIDLIPGELKAKLIKAKITTLEQLRRMHTSPELCFQVSLKVGLSLDEFHDLIIKLILFPVANIGVHHANLLVKVGVDSVEKLADANADVLIDEMHQIKQELALDIILPSRLVVDNWIKTAQSILVL